MEKVRKLKVAPVFSKDKALMRLYRRLNKKWFDGKLPNDVLVGWHYDGENYGCTGILVTKNSDGTTTESLAIALDPTIMNHSKWLMLTLIHEMCHVATQDEKKSHGPKFYKEKRRVMAAGAIDVWW